MVAPMARAAVAAGADGLIIEVHHDPDHALSDGAQSMFPAQFDRLMAELRIIAPAIGRSICLEPRRRAAAGSARPGSRTTDRALTGLATNLRFAAIAIAGLGLIGGSIALGVRDAVAVDSRRRRRPPGRARRTRCGERRHRPRRRRRRGRSTRRTWSSWRRPCSQNVAAAQRNCRRGTSLADARSSPTSAAPSATSCSAARRLPAGATFVGGHPIGGAERGGFGFARAGPVRGPSLDPDARPRPTPTRRSRARHVQSPGLGARPIDDGRGRARPRDGVRQPPAAAGRERADGHGRWRRRAGRAAPWRAAAWWIRPGWRRARRACGATSAPTNADAISGALDQLIDRLNDLRADLHRGEALEAVFGGAGRWRGELMKGRD